MVQRVDLSASLQQTERNLRSLHDSFATSVSRLASGVRIASAADDAAGVAISEHFRAQVRGTAQAQRNAQDAVSLILTAEGALNQTHALLARMRELSVQAANDTLSANDRAAIKLELDALSAEVDRIGTTTQFNTRALLDGTLYVPTVSATINSVGANLTGFTTSNVVVTAASTAPLGTGTVTVTNGGSQAILGDADTFQGRTGGSKFNFTITTAYGSNAFTDVTGPNINPVLNAINAQSPTLHVYAVAGGTNGGIQLLSGVMDPITLAVTPEVGSTATMTVTGAALDLQDMGLTTGGVTSVSATGADLAATLSGLPGESIIGISGKVLTTTSGTTINLGALTAQGPLATANTISLTFSQGQPRGLTFHIGPDTSQEQTLAIQDMRAAALQIATGDLVVTSHSAITQATTGTLAKIDTAIATVSSQRAALGAAQNRLENTLAMLAVSHESVRATESRIRDADVAAEAADLVRTELVI